MQDSGRSYKRNSSMREDSKFTQLIPPLSPENSESMKLIQLLSAVYF